MKMLVRTTAIALLAMSAPLAAKPATFAKVKFGAASPRGAVMFIAPPAFGDYVVWLSDIEPVDNRPRSLELFSVRDGKGVRLPDGRTVQLRDLDAGHYVVRMVTTQGFWGGCFSESTIAFDVPPGKITYLGVIDPTPSIASIIAEAERTGKTTSSSGRLRLMKENVLPPAFAADPTYDAASLLTFAKGQGLVTDATTVTASFAPARFNRRDKSDLTGYCQ